MKKINHALIMAAGRGTRMIPITKEIPKAMVPHNESTLIAHGITKIRKFIDNIHITVGYKKAMLAKHVIEHDVSSVFNTEGKGNAWWIYNTLLKHLDEPIFVLTCDNVTELDFEKLSIDYYNKKSPACFLVPVIPIEGLEGDYIFHKNNVVFELNRGKKSDIYCSGIQILNPYKVNQITEKVDDFYKVWSQLIEQKQLYCSDIKPEKWYTVDTPIQLKNINKLVINGEF